MYRLRKNKSELLETLQMHVEQRFREVTKARIIGHNRLAFWLKDGSRGILQHETIVLLQNPNGSATLNDGGWQSQLTLTAIDDGAAYFGLNIRAGYDLGRLVAYYGRGAGQYEIGELSYRHRIGYDRTPIMVTVPASRIKQKQTA